MNWHQSTVEDVLLNLQTSSSGISAEQASGRLKEYGPNEIAEKRGRSPLAMLIAQFADLMIIILIIAAIIAALIGDTGDALPILAIVLLNAAIGFVQEFRAEKALTALKKMAGQTARVVRGGNQLEIAARELVPGDLVLLDAGSVVPADMRLVEAARLQVDESALTGESVPVEKTFRALPDAALPAADRINMAWRGTIVVYGRGVGVVTATGMHTELGEIASMLSEGESTKTPLQIRLAGFGRRLAVVILIICAIVFAAGMLRGEQLLLMLLTSISLAVAAIPEALPAVVTIALAFGARRMVRKNALIRRLTAVETLGSVTCICTDKTGTLTMNRMEVTELSADTGTIAPEALKQTAPPVDSSLPADKKALLLLAATLCNDARQSIGTEISGDPTEVALARISAERGFLREDLEKLFPRIAELPFDSDRKMMTTIHRCGNGFVSFTKGAVEKISLRIHGSANNLSRAAEDMASRGLRTIGIAMREWDLLPDELDSKTVESGLLMLGIAGIMDPPRPEARDAVTLCKSAGITPIMITGDHAATAAAIARELGILSAGETLTVTGAEMERLDEEALSELAGKTRVFARVAPVQKLDIVKALQNRGEFVAMTGDGVNDAPALQKAEIGIAMGITGTDVAKGAASMVLLDDNFATIVTAISEGRRIYRNIIRFITYSLTSNAGTLWLVFLAPFFSLPLPLVPIQILWLNLLCDSLPGLALTAEPATPGLMHRPPTPPGEGILSSGRGQQILIYGLFIGLIGLVLQWWALTEGLAWQTIVLTYLLMSRMAMVMHVRSEHDSLLSIGFFSNRILALAIAVTVLLHFSVIYVPQLQNIFITSALSLREMGIVVAASCFVLITGEVVKLVKRIRHSS